MTLSQCAIKFAKYVIFFHNLFCAIGGVILMIHGGVSLLKINSLYKALPNTHLGDASLIPTIVVCFGLLIFLISFVGSVGAIRENRILLETYSIFLLTLVLMQIVLACLIFMFLDDINFDSLRSFNRIWHSRHLSLENRMMVDMIQENLECCGANNIYDYSLEGIPKSCCLKEHEICVAQNAFRIGCRLQLKESIESSGQIISYLCIVTAIFEFIGSLMGFILAGKIRRLKEKRRCC